MAGLNPPRIVIIAGPNGAGKTTFAQDYLLTHPAIVSFVNADLIARGLSPVAPESAAVQAGKIMLRQIDLHVQRRESFAFETTLSGRIYIRHISEWRKLGYFVLLNFLKLDSVDLALSRVAARMALGGHNIPEEVVRRRFDLGLRNFEQIYAKIVSAWELYDNSREEPRRLQTGINDEP